MPPRPERKGLNGKDFQRSWSKTGPQAKDKVLNLRHIKKHHIKTMKEAGRSACECVCVGGRAEDCTSLTQDGDKGLNLKLREYQLCNITNSRDFVELQNPAGQYPIGKQNCFQVVGLGACSEVPQSHQIQNLWIREGSHVLTFLISKATGPRATAGQLQVYFQEGISQGLLGFAEMILYILVEKPTSWMNSQPTTRMVSLGFFVCFWFFSSK